MTSLSPDSALAFGPGSIDSQQRIDMHALREQRMARARNVMKEHSIAAMLAEGKGYARYLTGLDNPYFADSVLWFVLFPVEGDPIVFMHAGYVARGPVDSPWIHEWRTARSWLRGTPGVEASKDEADAFAADICAELDRLQIAGERLAMAGFDAYARSALSNREVQWEDGEDLLQTAMAVKTPVEIDCIRMAGAITDRMYSAIQREVRPGMTESEASAIAREAALSCGADGYFSGFRAGPLAGERGIRGTNQIFLPGQLMIVNLCSTSYLGYKACVYRTFAVGREPTTEELGWLNSLRERLALIVEELTPGRSTADAAARFPAASHWGLGEEHEVLTMEIGHGLGLHQYERPVVNRQWSLGYPQPLEEGMVVAVESREGAPGRAVVRLEYMVNVTTDGPRLIDRFPTDITILE